jgi:chromosome segregation ATPase
MAASSLRAWERFYERVVARGGNWPRALWFAAVEDGLAGALTEGSRLLSEYRRHVAEWNRLESEAAGSHRNAQRVAQLEADIMRLIGYANQTIRESAADADRQTEVTMVPPLASRAGDRAWLAAATVGVMLLCGVLLGATYYQNRQTMQRLERDLAALHQRLTEQAADQRAALELRIGSVERMRQDLDAAHGELQANVAQFNQVMSESVRSITALGDSTLGDLARRWADQDGEVQAALSGLRERAAALDQGLAAATEGLQSVTHRLPGLRSDMDRLKGQVGTTRVDFERVAEQVETIKAQAPEIALWLEGQRQGLAQTLESQRRSVDEVDVEIAALHGALDESRGELVNFGETIEAGLARARQQSAELEQAIAEVHATGTQATDLVAALHGSAEATQGEARRRIDAILADLAAAADLAARRAEEIMKRTETEGARRLEAAAEQALASLIEAREQRLAELSRWAAATEGGLAQTQAGVVAGWRGMDEAVAARQSDVLGNLDRYAAILESRVQELLDALDVILVRSSG